MRVVVVGGGGGGRGVRVSLVPSESMLLPCTCLLLPHEFMRYIGNAYHELASSLRQFHMTSSYALVVSLLNG